MEFAGKEYDVLHSEYEFSRLLRFVKLCKFFAAKFAFVPALVYFCDWQDVVLFFSFSFREQKPSEKDHMGNFKRSCLEVPFFVFIT